LFEGFHGFSLTENIGIMKMAIYNIKAAYIYEIYGRKDSKILSNLHP